MSQSKILAVYNLPLWAAKALTEEDESLMTEQRHQALQFWTESLECSVSDFIILDETPVSVPFALFCGDSEPSVKVALTGVRNNIFKIEESLLLNEAATIACLLQSAKQTLQHPATSYDNGMICGEAWRAAAETFPETANAKSILEWAKFGSPLNQVWAIQMMEVL